MHSTRLSLNCRPSSDERALQHKWEMCQMRLLRQLHNIWRQGVVHDPTLLGAPAKEVVDNIVLPQTRMYQPAIEKPMRQRMYRLFDQIEKDIPTDAGHATLDIYPM